MDNFKVQALIAQGKIVTANDVDPTSSYLQVGVYQEGNRRKGSGNTNTYESYAIPMSELGCNDQVYNTGIYDYYPWVIEPTMIKSCTKVNDYPIFPTAFAANLEGYKVVGSTFVNNDNFVVEYIGTLEITSPDPFNSSYFPWKTTGNVTTYGDGFVPNISSDFGPGALVRDLGNSDDYVPADYMGIFLDEYDPGKFDMFLVVGSTAALGTIVADSITFDYEFLVVEGSDVKFTIY